MYTDKLFTGQREMEGLGIYHYGARFYSPKLGRFLSADTIVPGYANPQNLNRFSYVLNNPLRYTDPTGHWVNETNDPFEELRQKAKEHDLQRAERDRREKEKRNREKTMIDKNTRTEISDSLLMNWEQVQIRYKIIAEEQLQRYTFAFDSLSWNEDPFLKDFYLAEQGYWTAIINRNSSIHSWEAVFAGWDYLEKTLARAEMRGYFGEARQTDAILEDFIPEWGGLR